MMNNPEQLRQLMDSPVVQSMTSNPDLMRSLLMNNPQIRDLMDVSDSPAGLDRLTLLDF